jgi:broad specificity phosphatase PhoE
MTETIVHLLRHGEVYNPEGVLYGRRSGFHLSERGQAMAERVAESIGDRTIVHLVSSPLERAQETAAPLAKARGLEVQIDERVIESDNDFVGQTCGRGVLDVLRPSNRRRVYNPWKPSGGEPDKEMVARMMAAVHDARKAAEGNEAVVVSHQLPIWITRLAAEHRSFLHDPRKRHCTLCSLTSLHFEDDRLVKVSYSEPAADLIPAKDKGAPFSTGGAPEEERP